MRQWLRKHQLYHFEKPADQRGDTLIEVLICVLVVALILGGAYVTTHQASLAVRNSQEHAEALKLVQSQLEQLRQGASKTGGTTIFNMNPPFCMINGAPVSSTIAPGLAGCVQNAAGQATQAEPAYKITITRQDCSTVGPRCQVFAAKATWDDISGDHLNSEQLSYRLYQ